MAKFSQKTLVQVAGFDGQILAQELVYDQKDFWNFAWNTTQNDGSVIPVNFTGATIDSLIVRRLIVGLADSRAGLDFTILDYPGHPTPVVLPIVNRIDAAGTFTMVIDDDVWGVLADDPELNIAANDPVCFTGRIKIGFPAVGTQPAYDESVFLLFLITSDGVVN